jgi:hypothetical protein
MQNQRTEESIGNPTDWLWVITMEIGANNGLLLELILFK